MPKSKSLLSFPDCKDVFDKAILSENGVVMNFEDKAAMTKFMFRCFWFRSLDRDNNKVLYPDPGQTMHGRSVYDQITVRKDGNKLKFVKIKSDRFVVEVMTEPE
jgi:hypothetical protein